LGAAAKSLNAAQLLDQSEQLVALGKGMLAIAKVGPMCIAAFLSYVFFSKFVNLSCLLSFKAQLAWVT
jgi:hypothetical protein